MLKAFTIMRGNIANPIIQLTQAAQNVASGDLSKDIDIQAKGTMEELVESFKAMQNNLKSLVEDIESTGNLVAKQHTIRRVYLTLIYSMID